MRLRSFGSATWCAVNVVLLLVHGVQGQGLRGDNSPRPVRMAANNRAMSSMYAQYMRSFQRSRGLARSYRSVSKTSCTARRSRASLCAGLAAEEQEVLDLATNPQQFSWHDGWEGSLPNPFGPVGDQGDCSTCVTFTLAATAEAAVARALGLRGGSVSISEQDMGFCPEQPDNLKFCGTSWDFPSAMNKFSARQGKFVQKRCLPYTVTTEDDQGSTCRYKCRDVDPNIFKGVFKVRKIRSMASAQRQIRSQGGVITRLNVYKDFRKFFESNPTGVYGGELCSKGAAEDLEQEHAVVLVGYDNYNQFWIARNSWGTKFADKGYFRIKYGVCGIAGPDDTYGLIFEPYQRPKFKYTLSPDPDGTPGCYVYRAREGDTLGMLAEVWGVPVDELVANNSATVQDLDQGLQGKFLTVCGAQNINVLGRPPSAPSQTFQGPSTPAGASAKGFIPAPRPAPASPPPKPAPAAPTRQPAPAPQRPAAPRPAAPTPAAPRPAAPASAPPRGGIFNFGGGSPGQAPAGGVNSLTALPTSLFSGIGNAVNAGAGVVGIGNRQGSNGGSSSSSSSGSGSGAPGFSIPFLSGH